MSIAEQLTDINNSKQAIKTAIESKGQEVGSIPFNQYASKIAAITTGGGAPDSPIPWVRPSHYRPKPTILPGEQKIVALFSVYDTPNNEGNFCSFTCAGAYTVDWGNGTTSNHDSATSPDYNYDYLSLSNDFIIAPGVKQVYVTITPQSGSNLTNFTLTRRMSINGSLYSGGQGTGWNELIISMPFSTNINPSRDGTSVFHGSLTNIEIVAAQDNTSLSFTGLVALEQVKLPEGFTTDKTMSSVFSGCSSLVNAPMMNLTNGPAQLNFSSMFANCRSLVYVPPYNLSAATNTTSMFSNCLSLVGVPDSVTNIPLVTQAATMFSGCASLHSVKLNAPSVQNLQEAFKGCAALETIDITTGTSLTNLRETFMYCRSLREIPFFVTTNVTNMANMVSYCNALVKIGELDFSKVSTIIALYDGFARECFNLKRLPESMKFLPASLTSPQGAFYACEGLEYVPEFVNSNVWTTVSTSIYNIGMFQGCPSLKEIPAINLSGVTAATNFFGTNSSLQRNRSYGLRVSFTQAGSMLDGNALNEVISNLGNPATTQTLTISSTPGATRWPALSRSSTTTAGSQTIACSNTASFVTGMQVTGTGVSDAINVTLNAATNTVEFSSHGLPNGKEVSFSTITTTTGLSVFSIYYVINSTTDSFQLSLTPNGDPVSFTNNGTGTALYQTKVTDIVNNVSVTVDVPARTSATNNLVYRNINTQIAVMKRWTVTG